MIADFVAGSGVLLKQPDSYINYALYITKFADLISFKLKIKLYPFKNFL